MQPSIKIIISYIDATYNSNLPDECDRDLSHCMAVSNVGLDHFCKGLLDALQQIVASQQHINARKEDCKFFKPISHIHTCLCTVVCTSFITINTRSLKTQDFYYLQRLSVLVLLKYGCHHAIITESKLATAYYTMLLSL